MIARRGTLALMARSLRVDSRSLRTYVPRGVLAGLILLGLISAYVESAWRSAAGLYVFTWIVIINGILLTLAGVSYFATVISEEREQGTLGLLRITDLNGISIILGKSATRVVNTIALLLVQFPFALLAITLGGVAINQVIAAYCMLLAYTLGLGGVALLWSVLCRRSRNASGMMVLTLLFFFVAPVVGRGLLFVLQQKGYLATDDLVSRATTALFDWLEAASPIMRMLAILGTGFSADVVSFQVITNAAAGVVCFFLAWLAFSCLHRDDLPADPGGAKAPSGKRLARRRSNRRAWRAALVWKDFQYTGGGIMGWFFRLVIYGVTVTAIYILSNWQNRFDPARLGVIMVWTAIVGAVIESALFAGHVFRDEIRWQTLPSLMILPTSLARFAYAKIAGCLLSLAPVVALFCAGAMLTPDDVHLFLKEAMYEPRAWLGVGIAVAMCLFFVHLVAFLSLYLKWGALAAAVGILVIGSICFSMVVSMFSMMMALGSRVDEDVVAVVVLITICGLTALLHVLSGLRLVQLAGQ